MKKLLMLLCVAGLATSSALAAATATSMNIDSTSTAGKVIVDFGAENNSGWHFEITTDHFEFGKPYDLADMDSACYNNQGTIYDAVSASLTINQYKGGYRASGFVRPEISFDFEYSSPKITLDITTDAVVGSKEYDGSTAATITTAAVLDESAIWGTDDVTLTATAAFADAAVGTGKTVTITYALEGADAEDYVLSKESATLTDGVITPIQLTASMIGLRAKDYDATDTINVSTFNLNGVLAGDAISGTAVGYFADKNAKMNKDVTVKFAIEGANAANYIAPADSAMKVSINRKKVEFVGTAVEDKEYDGTFDAVITDLGSLSGLIEGDDVTFTAQAVYFNNDKHVGTDKDVLVKYEISGNDADNYLVREKEIPLKASIIKRQLAAEGIVVTTAKMEDSTDVAAITTQPTLLNVIGVDKVTLSATATYDNATFGENKTITIKYEIAGADTADYAAPVDSIYTTAGKIIQATKLVLPDGATEFFVVDSVGYAPGETAQLGYQILQGTPTTYRIICSDEAKAQGFADVDWTALPADSGSLALAIPNPCEPGKYKFGVQMNNELDVPTDTLDVTVMVDLPESWLDNIFDDMVTLVDPDGKYAGLTYQWFQDDQPIKGATLPYYYQEGGLTGVYFLIMNIGTENEIRTVKVSYSSTPKAVKSIRKEARDGQIIIIDENGAQFNTNGVKLF